MKPSIFKTLAQPVRKVKEDQLLNKNKNQPVYESKVQKIEAIKAKYNITQQTTTRRQELTHYKSNSRSISAGKTRQNNRRILNENMNYGNTKDSRNIRNFQSQKQTLAKHTKTESKVIKLNIILKSNNILGKHW